MDLSHLLALFREARKLTKHREFVVIGSLSILGIVRESSGIPGRMLMSIDVDCYTKDDPARIFELEDKLGQGSPFEARHGFYLDPVSPEIATLPDNWQFRLIPVELGEGIVVQLASAAAERTAVRERSTAWSLASALLAGRLAGP